MNKLRDITYKTISRYMVTLEKTNNQKGKTQPKHKLGKIARVKIAHLKIAYILSLMVYILHDINDAEVAKIRTSSKQVDDCLVSAHMFHEIVDHHQVAFVDAKKEFCQAQKECL